MPAIRIGTQTLELAGSSQLALERNSPLLSPPGERGSSSLAFRLAKTPANDAALGYPNRFDHREGQAPQRLAAEALDDVGNGIVAGNVVYRGVEPDAYLYNLEFGDSAVMNRLKARKLQQFRFGGPRLMEPTAGRPAGFETNLAVAMNLFQREVLHAPEAFDFAFAPFSNNDHAGRWDAYVSTNERFNGSLTTGQVAFVPTHNANFNTWAFPYGATEGGFVIPAPGQFTVMGLPPLDFGLENLDAGLPCPLPKLEYVVRTIFEELQLALDTDVFAEPDMQQLVVVPVAGVIEFVERPGGTGTTDQAGYFHLANHLPGLNAAEFLRGLMDEFGWHFDQDPSGQCRLLRAAPLVLSDEAVNLTSLVGPAFTSEPSEPISVVVRPNLPAGDRYIEEFGEQPDPTAIMQPVATVADLGLPAAADQYRLVQSAKRYYRSVTQSGGTSQAPTTSLVWEPGPFYLPGVQVGEAENTEEYALGTASVLTCPIGVYVGQAVQPVPLLCFMEPSFTNPPVELTAGQTSAAGAQRVATRLVRSQTIRLAFYRGLQPLTEGATPALIPWLTQGNRDPLGVKIGNLTLEAHGPDGVVQRKLLPLMALKAAATLVKFPAYFSPYQFTHLDLSRMVSIRGDEFMVRRLSLALPLTRPGQLELVPSAQVARLKARPLVSDGFYLTTEDAPAGLTCKLLITEVLKNGDVATVKCEAAQGSLKYQLDHGPIQESNVFTGLVDGQSYVFWVYDLGVTGCHRFVLRTW